MIKILLCVPLLALSVPTNTDVELLNAREKAARKKVAALRGTEYDAAVNMNSDATAVKAVKKLQDVTRKLLLTKYSKYLVRGGKEGAQGTVLRMKCDVTFPDRMHDLAEKGKTGTFVIETAPIELLPHSVMNFVELVKSKPEQDPEPPFFWLNAPHILMMEIDHDVHNDEKVAFQEYSTAFPHEPYTVGFGGRPAGRQIYISTMNNTLAHGPGSQGSKMNEADVCFGHIAEGRDVVDRLKDSWGKRELGFDVYGNDDVHLKEEQAQISFRLCKKGVC
jgi:cyclophilin family peptidyl-prolyl cis-trans isomerase